MIFNIKHYKYNLKICFRKMKINTTNIFMNLFLKVLFRKLNKLPKIDYCGDNENHTIINGYDKPESEAIKQENLEFNLIHAIYEEYKEIKNILKNKNVLLRYFPEYELLYDAFCNKYYHQIFCRLIVPKD